MYVRIKDGIYEYTNNNVFKYITKETIVDAGYGKTLPKGSFVKIGETWVNYYGRWTSIIDKDGNIYDIRPNRVEEVIEEIEYKQADTIEELCDEFVIKQITSPKPYVADGYQKTQILKDRQKTFEYGVKEIKGAIYTDKGLIYVAKMNDKGELVLI